MPRSSNALVQWTTASNSITTSSAATWVSWNREYTRIRTYDGWGNENTCTANTITCGSSDRIWAAWNTLHTATTNTVIVNNHYEMTWRGWNHDWVPSSAPVVHIPGRAQETPEERAARDAANRQWAAEREAAMKAEEAMRKEAKDRAQKLLLSVLDEEQRRDWVQSGFFFLHKGEKTYKITRGRSGNVELVGPDKQPLERYCAHPVQTVPDEDTALAQLMYLLYDEEAFIALANVHFTKQGFDGQKRGLRSPGRALILPMPQAAQAQRQAA